MQRYQSYEDVESSGIEWLGDIPTHWETLQGNRLFGERKERIRPDDEMLTASQKYGVIPQAEFMRREDQKVMQVYLNAEILKHVEPDDFVISMRSFQGGLEFCAYSGCVSSAYVGIFALKQVEPTFFKYLFKSSPYIQALQSTSNLVRDGQALRFQNFSMVRLPVIPKDEQKQIASFLDYETAKIDALIEKQQQLIALLGEKRQAVISHAVTKGLNPDAPMRDSGVEWLGEVPEHWTVKKLFWLTDRIGDGLHGTPSYDDSTGQFFINGNNLENGQIQIDSKTREVNESEFQKHFIALNESTVLLSINGTIGKTALYDGEPVILGKSAAYIHCRQELIPAFLRMFFDTANAIQYYHLVSTGTTISNLSLDSIRQLKIGIPSLAEQKEIVDWCRKATSKFDTLTQRAEAAAELLRERRTALISAAVTGKIDVRGWKRPSAAPKKETEMEVA